ncbi:hypothetical protein AARAC_006643 [Aspergillus arachidicola]|uniref:Uncharacterized protein n=1 Tax=Aspergillus arachidicola TaxID=656916 RepID=A0A2G7EMN0_9EURO|nr:hypothetical protein AARAC_006643 [Aspergillus arachidicola]
MPNSYLVSIRPRVPPRDDNDLARDPGTKEGPLIDFIRNAVEREGLTVEDSEYRPSPNVFPPQYFIAVKINDNIDTESLENNVREQWMIKAQESIDFRMPADINVEDAFDF